MLKYKEKGVGPAHATTDTDSLPHITQCYHLYDEVTTIRGFQVSEKWKKSPCLLRCGCSGVVVGKVTAVPGAGPCCCCAAVWRLLRAVVFRHRAPSHLHHSRDTRDVRPSWRHQTLCSLTVLCRSPHTPAILNRRDIEFDNIPDSQQSAKQPSSCQHCHCVNRSHCHHDHVNFDNK